MKRITSDQLNVGDLVQLYTTFTNDYALIIEKSNNWLVWLWLNCDGVFSAQNTETSALHNFPYNIEILNA